MRGGPFLRLAANHALASPAKKKNSGLPRIYPSYPPSPPSPPYILYIYNIIRGGDETIII